MSWRRGGEIDESSVICCPLVGSVAELSEKPSRQRLPRTHGGNGSRITLKCNERELQRVLFIPLNVCFRLTGKGTR